MAPFLPKLEFIDFNADVVFNFDHFSVEDNLILEETKDTMSLNQEQLTIPLVTEDNKQHSVNELKFQDDQK